MTIIKQKKEKDFVFIQVAGIPDFSIQMLTIERVNCRIKLQEAESETSTVPTIDSSMSIAHS